ncbi:receptor-like protein 6 [Amaranthus tricolor]|uniref:receptor-like protein 6 n=1 Tax=Amaranthus tricolor TaxID=29722 RepID=UPI002586C01D|nr:receptor-like protein 6 [Amaranthus tricolor]
MTNLESLDLSQNMLSGEIPQTLAQLTSLEVFNVSHNRLVGPIPQGEQFNTFDDSSFQGNLALCGFPLPEKCGNRDFPPESAPTQVTEDNSMWIDWLVRSLGCASGFIVGFVIGKIFITDKHHDWFIDTFGRRKWPKTRARSAPRGPRNS